jgi:hypothetical protein
LFEKAHAVRRHFKVALSGKWKTGKTRAALSFPNPAVLDTHRGTDLYDQKYDFRVLHATTWKEMQAPIEWLQKNAAKEGIETLVIDDMSSIYDDLINDVSLWRTNKSGAMAPLNPGDWGTIKRRFKAFLQMLLRLDTNVVLVIREKDEYADSANSQGQEVRKKTGNVIPDIDRQTLYLFDFILEMYCEDDKKKGTSKHIIRVDGTRHSKLPKYSVHDITGKRLYAELFEPIKGEVERGLPVPQVEPLVVPDTSAQEVAQFEADNKGVASESAPAPATPEEHIEDLKKFFGVVPISEDQPAATLEDVKVLMSRANEMRWPDDGKRCRKQGCAANGHIHPWFKTSEGKTLIHSLYNVESTKELRKPQIDFLFDEFGKVLAGRAFLDRDGEGTVYVATPSGETEEEVKERVLSYTK